MPQPEWEDLERRIAHIERHLGIAPDSAASTSVSATPIATPIATPAVPPLSVGVDAAALLPILGRALLGLAGAYLLRALTEGEVLAPQVGVAIGILYAVAWLVWAARTPAARRLEAALHSLSAALVLAPLLWEATLHFHAISTPAAGALLTLFTLFGLAVFLA